MSSTTRNEQQKQARKRQKEAGKARITWALDQAVVDIVRRIAKVERRTQSEVVDLAIRVLEAKLAQPVPVSTGDTQTTKVDPARQSPSAPTREPWWPEDADAFLRGNGK